MSHCSKIRPTTFAVDKLELADHAAIGNEKLALTVDEHVEVISDNYFIARRMRS